MSGSCGSTEGEIAAVETFLCARMIGRRRTVVRSRADVEAMVVGVSEQALGMGLGRKRPGEDPTSFGANCMLHGSIEYTPGLIYKHEPEVL